MGTYRIKAAAAAMIKEAMSPLTGRAAFGAAASGQDTWDCYCGNKGITGNFCGNCGKKKGE